MPKSEEQKVERYIPSQEEIKKLEADLQDFRSRNEKCDNLLSFGEEITNEKAKKTLREKEKKTGKDFTGWIINPLLDFVHWSVVKYAMNNGLISRKEGLWYVMGKRNTTKISRFSSRSWVDTNGYYRFKKKLDAWKDQEWKKDNAAGKAIDQLEKKEYGERGGIKRIP